MPGYSVYRLLILQGVLPMVGKVPHPISFILGAGNPSANSMSNIVQIIAKVTIISTLAKCRPGYIRCPPPKGIHAPARPSVVNTPCSSCLDVASCFSSACSGRGAGCWRKEGFKGPEAPLPG